MTDQNSSSDKNASMVDDAERSRPRRRTWVRPTLVGPAIIAVVLAAVFLRQENASPAAAAEDDPLNYAEVMIADPVEVTTLKGVAGLVMDAAFTLGPPSYD